jgi:ribosomal protein S18 acetylase RimI-like enzyme
VSVRPAWRVRVARADEAEAIARVSVPSWQAAYRGMMRDEVLAALSIEAHAETWRERICDQGNPDGMWVVEAAEPAREIAGFVSLGPARDADLDPVRVGEIWAIYVNPHCWGTGAGEALWRSALDVLRARGFVECVVWVLDENARARGFYARQGAICDGGVKTPIEDGSPLPHVRYALRLR